MTLLADRTIAALRAVIEHLESMSPEDRATRNVTLDDLRRVFPGC